MKKYTKPELEVVEFATENITEGPSMGVEQGDEENGKVEE